MHFTISVQLKKNTSKLALSLLNDWNTSEHSFISCPTNSRNSCMTLSQNWDWKSFNFIQWINNFLSFHCRTPTFSWDMMRGSKITEFLTTLWDIGLLSKSFFAIVETNWIEIELKRVETIVKRPNLSIVDLICFFELGNCRYGWKPNMHIFQLHKRIFVV